METVKEQPIINLLTKEFQLDKQQIAAVLNLFEEGATIPFIARYRKEKTGGLEEDVLREIEDRKNYLTLLADRKKTVLESIEEQGKLTDELKAKILAALKLQEVEDLYLPYKPKRKTRGTIAKAKGLEPLALFIMENPFFEGDILEKAAEFINPEKEVNNAADALAGAKDILAEMMSDTAEIRQEIRDFLLETALVTSTKVEEKRDADEKNLKLKEKDKKEVYKTYYDFQIPAAQIKPYQTLAIYRGEREKFLKASFSFDDELIRDRIYKIFTEKKKTVFEDLLREVTADSFKRLLYPSLERDVRNTLGERADEHAIEIFADNLRSLLLQPPLSDKKIMGIDPGFASGSKVAIIDKTGRYLGGETIYPHPPYNKKTAAEKTVLRFIEKYDVDIVAIGNGTASRETEQFVAEMIKKHSLSCHYVIVNEAGASVYSASVIAKAEFPDLDASMRGNISIARRLLDPLAELVKIDPKSIGVGLYQHDVDQKFLAKKLDEVVVSCVNYVGVDVNTASASLLTYVSGLSRRLAEKIVRYREEIGSFSSRAQLKDVSGIGEKVFEQCAGFLKIPHAGNPLDNTFIHPESYDATVQLLDMFKIEQKKLKEAGTFLSLMLKQKGTADAAAKLGIGEPTLIDIVDNLKKPGRDPREDMPKPILRSDVLKMEDLASGMMLKGTVRNVVDFGAFVDIGVKQDGLLHISRMRNAYVKNPLEVVHVGDVIEVKIIEVDIERGRISLSLVD